MVARLRYVQRFVKRTTSGYKVTMSYGFQNIRASDDAAMARIVGTYLTLR